MSDEEIEILVEDKSKELKRSKSDRYKCPRCVQGFKTTHALLAHIGNHKFNVRNYVRTAKETFKNGKYAGVPPECPDCQATIFPSNSVYTLPLQKAFKLLDGHLGSCIESLEIRIQEYFGKGGPKDSQEEEDNTDVIVIDGNSSSEANDVPCNDNTPKCDYNESGDKETSETDKGEAILEVIKQCFPSPKYKERSLSHSTVLEYLDNSTWSSCPSCPDNFESGSDCLVHLLSHTVIMEKLGKFYTL